MGGGTSKQVAPKPTPPAAASSRDSGPPMLAGRRSSLDGDRRHSSYNTLLNKDMWTTSAPVMNKFRLAASKIIDERAAKRENMMNMIGMAAESMGSLTKNSLDLAKLRSAIDDDAPNFSEAQREAALDHVRASFQQAQALVTAAQEALGMLGGDPARGAARTGFLASLHELLGPPPDHTWRDEWVALRAEVKWRQGDTTAPDEALVRSTEGVEHWCNIVKGGVARLVERGWPQEEAEAYMVLAPQSNAMAVALRRHEPRYAASTYCMSNALFEAQRRQESVPPRLYWHRTGKNSLMEADPSWEQLEKPSHGGFLGLTCSAMVPCQAEERCFCLNGFRPRLQDASGERYEDRDSDVVAFDSALDDEHGSHSAILTTIDERGCFPPNTLFRLREILEPGTWEAPGGQGLRPERRLFVVTATYRSPLWLGSDEDSGGKMCDNVAVLRYGSTADYATGFGDLFETPIMTLQQEYEREMSWVDWRGIKHTLRGEWKYVQGKAVALTDGVGRLRDEGNHGKTLHTFRKEVNAYILKERRTQEGTADTADGRKSMDGVADSHAFLSLDEVAAVRLYTGPSYQPINGFLRQLSNVTGDFRKAIVMHPHLTFAATVGHLCDAVRKLAACTTDEEFELPLYRAVRGELPNTFWTPDMHGHICATDTAFMSTSRNKETPVSYMSGEGHNVLWVLHPSKQSTEGFHHGANVAMLSQYPKEEEILFPPYTMMQLRKNDGEARNRLKKGLKKGITARSIAAAATSPQRGSAPAAAPPSVSVPAQDDDAQQEEGGTGPSSQRRKSTVRDLLEGEGGLAALFAGVAGDDDDDDDDEGGEEGGEGGGADPLGGAVDHSAEAAEEGADGGAEPKKASFGSSTLPPPRPALSKKRSLTISDLGAAAAKKMGSGKRIAISMRAKSLMSAIEAEQKYATEVEEAGKEYVMLRAVPTFI